MSKTSTKGRAGELGAQNFLNGWFTPDEITNGYGAETKTSQGQNDVGDIGGVKYTCIEVKNYTNPPFSSLMNNAEIKAANSRRPVWWLVWKRQNYGTKSLGGWHSGTTVEGFLNAFHPHYTVNEEGVYSSEWLGEAEQHGLTIGEVASLCDYDFTVAMKTTRKLPGLIPSSLGYTLHVSFRSFKARIDHNRAWAIHDLGHSFVHGGTDLPIVIHPRVGYPVEKWWVYTEFWAAARLLESVGILPARPDEDHIPDNVRRAY